MIYPDTLVPFSRPLKVIPSAGPNLPDSRGWRRPPTTNRRYLRVSTQAEFSGFMRRLSREQPSYLTLDTEFSDFRDLQLIQVGLPQGDAYVLDPMRTGVDLSAFANVLADPFILKIFHAPAQDLRILQSFFGVQTFPVFDTQVVALRQGLTSRSGGPIGYGDLVEALLGIRLDKSLQQSDWSSPTLTTQQLDYAALDVIHLRDVYIHLISPYF